MPALSLEGLVPDLQLCGHVSVGVGRTPRPCSVQGVVGAGEVAAHQSSGNEGIVLTYVTCPSDKPITLPTRHTN